MLIILGRVMVKRLSNEIALDAIKKIHGDKYDYSLFNYTRALNKVALICKNMAHSPCVTQT